MHKHSINIDLLLYHPTSVSPIADPQLSKEGKEMLWDFWQGKQENIWDVMLDKWNRANRSLQNKVEKTFGRKRANRDIDKGDLLALWLKTSSDGLSTRMRAEHGGSKMAIINEWSRGRSIQRQSHSTHYKERKSAEPVLHLNYFKFPMFQNGCFFIARFLFTLMFQCLRVSVLLLLFLITVVCDVKTQSR